MATPDLVGSVSGLIPSIDLTLITTLFLMIGVGMIAFLRGRHYLWPIQVNIRQRLGGGYGYVKANAQIQKNDGQEELYVYELKKGFPKPEPDKLLPMRGMFKKKVYYAYLDENGDIVPEQFDDKTYVSMPRSADMGAWAVQERKRLEQKYGDTWSKYGVLIGQGVIAVTLIVVSLLIMNKHVEAAEILGNKLTEVATILQTIK